MDALLHGYEAVAMLLLDKGADPNSRCPGDMDRLKSLRLASQNSLEAVIRSLFGKGNDVNASDDHKTTPLILASSGGHEVVARLLNDKGANINSMDFYRSPLMRASQQASYWQRSKRIMSRTDSELLDAIQCC
jgi:ankyrin repeat protein